MRYCLKPEYLELVAAKEGGDYYLKMMKAWFFATALAYRFDEAIIYAKPGRLDEWTRKKNDTQSARKFQSVGRAQGPAERTE